jgi:hypothetical protein
MCVYRLTDCAFYTCSSMYGDLIHTFRTNEINLILRLIMISTSWTWSKDRDNKPSQGIPRMVTILRFPHSGHAAKLVHVRCSSVGTSYAHRTYKLYKPKEHGAVVAFFLKIFSLEVFFYNNRTLEVERWREYHVHTTTRPPPGTEPRWWSTMLSVFWRMRENGWYM